MDLGAGGEFQFVRDGVDDADDLERSEVAEGELVVGATRHHRLHVGLELDEDDIPDDEGAVSAFLVSLRLHDVARSMEVLGQHLLHMLALLEPVLEGGDGTSRGRFDAPMTWFMPIQRKKR